MVGKIHRNSLKPGYKLHWYEIKDILGQGGFGITYLAYDPNLEKHVAIKEYLPIELAVREGDFSVHPVSEDHSEQYSWGLDRFITEARTLTKFKHPNIVKVLSVSEANNTAYMVMEYEKGQSLQEKLKGRKTLEEAELLKILFPIMGGLEHIHKAGFIHRDIKPDNIFIREDGSPLLLDFGSARQALGEQTKTLTSLVSPGYSPFEQYFSKSDDQGEWTDIYGMGATLYRAITGAAPMDAVDRSNALLKRTNDSYVSLVATGQGKYSRRFLKAVDHALQFSIEDRPQTIAEWRAEFGLPDAPLASATTEHIPTQPGTIALSRGGQSLQVGGVHAGTGKTNKSRGLKIVAVLLLLFFGVGIYFQDDLQNGIQQWKRNNEIQSRLVNAIEDMAAERFTQPAGDNALENYHQILQLEPENAEALLGLQSITDQLVSMARNLIREKQFTEAKKLLTQSATILPDAATINLATNELAKARAAQEKVLAEEKARKEQLASITFAARTAADKGKLNETLGLIEKARRLAVKEQTITDIKSRLRKALEIQSATAASQAKQAINNKDTKAARVALNQARILKEQLEKLN